MSSGGGLFIFSFAGAKRNNALHPDLMYNVMIREIEPK